MGRSLRSWPHSAAAPARVESVAGATNAGKAISSLDRHVYVAFALETWKDTGDLSCCCMFLYNSLTWETGVFRFQWVLSKL